MTEATGRRRCSVLVLSLIFQNFQRDVGSYRPVPKNCTCQHIQSSSYPISGTFVDPLKPIPGTSNVVGASIVPYSLWQRNLTYLSLHKSTFGNLSYRNKVPRIRYRDVNYIKREKSPQTKKWEKCIFYIFICSLRKITRMACLKL